MGSKTKFYQKGQSILEEGELSFEAYIILEGEVDVFKMVFNRNYPTKEVHLATLSKGAIFGEIGWLQHLPRTATVKANTDCKVYVLSEEDAQLLIKHNPKALMPVLKIVCTRMADILDIIEEK